METLKLRKIANKIFPVLKDMSQGNGVKLESVVSVGLERKIFWCPLEVIRDVHLSNPGNQINGRPFSRSYLSLLPLSMLR